MTSMENSFHLVSSLLSSFSTKYARAAGKMLEHCEKYTSSFHVFLTLLLKIEKKEKLSGKRN